MAETHIIETLGSITKVENIRTLVNNIIPKTFVVETLEPFPGYHGSGFVSASDDINKKSVFLIVNKRLSSEGLCRAVVKIRKYIGFGFNAAVSELTIFNQHYNAIRIKRFEKIENIEELQYVFREEGFQFVKPRKVSADAIIKVKKYMLLEEYSNEIYFDHEEPDFAYFRLPSYLNWKLFEDITLRIKHNLPDINYDFAQGVIFRRTGLMDVVRIYGEKPDLKLLEMLKEKYEDAIKRLI